MELQKWKCAQKLKCEGDWASYSQKVACSDNSEQFISHKVKKYSKIGQDFKNGKFNFACSLTAIVNV